MDGGLAGDCDCVVDHEVTNRQKHRSGGTTGIGLSGLERVSLPLR